MAHAHSMLDT